eukprot:scaffold3826_cov407-Prasinococcus_capsulatus_cf.AAC.19
MSSIGRRSINACACSAAANCNKRGRVVAVAKVRNSARRSQVTTGTQPPYTQPVRSRSEHVALTHMALFCNWGQSTL